MNPIVVACVGSPFGADNLGHRVAQILFAHPVVQSLPEQLLRIEASDRPQLNLLAQIEGAQLAIIVDAVQGGLAPGQLLRIDAAQLAGDGGRLSSHAVGVAEALALGRALDLLPPRVLIMGLTMGESLQWQPDSEVLRKLADSVVGEVAQFRVQLELSHNAIAPSEG